MISKKENELSKQVMNQEYRVKDFDDNNIMKFLFLLKKWIVSIFNFLFSDEGTYFGIAMIRGLFMFIIVFICVIQIIDSFPNINKPKIIADINKPKIIADINKPEIIADINKPEIIADINKPEIIADINKPEIIADINKPESWLVAVWKQTIANAKGSNGLLIALFFFFLHTFVFKKI